MLKVCILMYGIDVSCIKLKLYVCLICIVLCVCYNHSDLCSS